MLQIFNHYLVLNMADNTFHHGRRGTRQGLTLGVRGRNIDDFLPSWGKRKHFLTTGIHKVFFVTKFKFCLFETFHPFPKTFFFPPMKNVNNIPEKAREKEFHSP